MRRRRSVVIGVALFTGCGFLPRGTSRVGTESLESASKPVPVTEPLGSCGPEGSQPDYALNRWKNRVDEGSWLDTPWTVVAKLPWPHAVGFRFRNQWTPRERDAVARFEGAPVRVEGYLQGFKLEGREPTNCYSNEPAERDYHLWFAENPNEARKRSVVIEITPRVRRAHPGWTEERLALLVASQSRVRVSGWVMLDQMHPERVGINRVTLWEVHPILHIDVQQAGRWISLDSLPDATSAVTETTRPQALLPSSPHPR
jgi:hypothetical protein